MVEARNTAGAQQNGASGSKWVPVSVLEEIKSKGAVWGSLASKYGVTNPDPPWKTSLEGMCEALDPDACLPEARKAHDAPAALPALERRCEEDELSESLYQHVPFPERQLLALTHSLIKRGLVNEAELARRMEEVHKRLNAT